MANAREGQYWWALIPERSAIEVVRIIECNPDNIRFRVYQFGTSQVIDVHAANLIRCIKEPPPPYAAVFVSKI